MEEALRKVIKFYGLFMDPEVAENFEELKHEFTGLTMKPMVYAVKCKICGRVFRRRTFDAIKHYNKEHRKEK